MLNAPSVRFLVWACTPFLFFWPRSAQLPVASTRLRRVSWADAESLGSQLPELPALSQIPIWSEGEGKATGHAHSDGNPHCSSFKSFTPGILYPWTMGQYQSVAFEEPGLTTGSEQQASEERKIHLHNCLSSASSLCPRSTIPSSRKNCLL